jgi:hypothetical protein
MMLDALAVAAGSFLLGIPEAVGPPINQDEIRAVSLVLGQTVTGETVVGRCASDQSAQSSIFNPGTWPKSFPLRVTRVTRSASVRTAIKNLGFSGPLIAEVFGRAMVQDRSTAPAVGLLDDLFQVGVFLVLAR